MGAIMRDTGYFSLLLEHDEAIGVLNALNYFGFGVDADTCHTVTGLDQDRVQALHARLHLAHRGDSTVP
jgi:hypothetical protein